MKIAVISDIHGNVAALDAVLADAAKRKVDEIVNLGDICSGGLFPRETLDRLMPLGLKTVRGNHDRQIINRPLENMSASDRYAAEQLRPDQLHWLAALPATLRLQGDVLMVHGTPDSDSAYFLENVIGNGLQAATVAEVKARAGDVDAAVILCGHTHLQRVFPLDDGRIVVNPGSVGQPAYSVGGSRPHVSESGSPHARYAIIYDDRGSWTADLHIVEYDWDQAASDAQSHGRADLSYPLRTGLIARD